MVHIFCTRSVSVKNAQDKPRNNSPPYERKQIKKVDLRRIGEKERLLTGLRIFFLSELILAMSGSREVIIVL